MLLSSKALLKPARELLKKSSATLFLLLEEAAVLAGPRKLREADLPFTVDAAPSVTSSHASSRRRPPNIRALDLAQLSSGPRRRIRADGSGSAGNEVVISIRCVPFFSTRAAVRCAEGHPLRRILFRSEWR